MDIESRDENLVKKLLSVYKKSIEHLYNTMPNKDIEEMNDNTEKMIKNIENLIIVKNNDENIIGFMGCEDENLEMLYLHPDYKKQGLGKELMNIAINNHNVSKAHIVKVNTDGIDFCKHMGFIPCEITNGSIYNEAIEMKLSKEAN